MRVRLVLALLLAAAHAHARSTDVSLVAPARAPGDRFGAALDGGGTTLAVGAPGTGGTGAVHVFVRAAGSWSLQATLVAAGAAAGDELGAAVALDGDTIVAGAPGRAGGTGAAYVFTRAAGVWSERAVLVPDGAAAGWRAGAAVDVAGDLAIVGMPGALGEAGGAVGFVGVGASWTAIGAVVDGAALQAGDRAGHAVATDGATVVVGAPLRDGPSGEADLGIVFVGTRSGNAVAPIATLGHRAPNVNDRFGSGVDVRGDAIAVGVPSGRRPVRGGIATAPGAVETFGLVSGAWTSTARLSAFGPGNARGESVRIGGTRLLSGAPFSGGTANVVGEAAALYVSFRAGSGWQDAGERLTADVDDDLDITSGLGSSVALTDDTIAGGAPAIDEARGRVFLFESRPPVIDAPPAATPSSVPLLEPIRFDAAASDPDGDDVRLFWDFADGDGSLANPTTHRYRAPGSYDVRLLATDGIGETSATVRVEVAPPTRTMSSLTFVERLRERLQPTGGGGDDDGEDEIGAAGGGGGEREIGTTAQIRLQGVLALTPDDVAALNADGRFRLALGDLLIDVTLGLDAKYAAGATRATIVRGSGDDDDGGANVRWLTLRLDWSAGALRFKAKVIPSQRFRSFTDTVLGNDLAGTPSGRRAGALAGAATFGPASATFVRSWSGKVATVDKESRRGRRTYRSTVKIKGKGSP